MHANGNIYATGRVTFLAKVTTANEFIYDVMRNGNTFNGTIAVNMTMMGTGTNVPITMGPQWMIIWPFDPKTSGLSATPKDTGAYIMWAGSPYAHVHIEIYPWLRMPGRLKFLAGSEVGAGVFTADTLPEATAAELRAVELP